MSHQERQSRKAREALKRRLHNQAIKDGKLPSHKEIENRANASGDRVERRRDK